MLKGYIFTLISIYNMLENFNLHNQENIYLHSQYKRTLTFSYTRLWHNALLNLSKYDYSILIAVMKAIDYERKSKSYESKESK